MGKVRQKKHEVTSKALKYKNGQLFVSPDGRVTVGREGWFGHIWESITHQPTTFSVYDVLSQDKKKPGITRGYIRLKTDQGTSELWITNKDMWAKSEQLLAYMNAIRQQKEETDD